MANKIDVEKKTESDDKKEKFATKLKEDQNKAEVYEAASKAAKEKVAEIKEREIIAQGKGPETIGERLHKNNIKKIEKELKKAD